MSYDHSLLISIDMGTYGFFAAFASPSNVKAAQPIQEWPGKPDGITYEKVLNTILLRKSNPSEVIAFGWEAREAYIDAKEQKRPEFSDMAYFENFKLQLKQGGDTDFDATKQIFAVDKEFTQGICPLVAQCLGEIKRQSLAYYRRRIGSIEDDQVFWILTVPVEWADQSVEAMKICCDHPSVGISRDNLLIVTEAEAAGNYLIWGTETGEAMPVGSKFVVLDCGCGTFDLVAQEIVEVDGERQVRDIHHAEGGMCGAVNVDEVFVHKLLAHMFGEATVDRFQREFPADYVEQMRDFQTVREKVEMGEQKRKIQLSAMLIDLADEADVDYEANAASYRVDDDEKEVLKFKSGRNKLEIYEPVWRQLHDAVVKRILDATQEMLDGCDGIERLFLVGGFSQSSYVKNGVARMLDDEYDHVEFVTCLRPQVAVPMGALWAARRKVVSRKLRFSYGIAVDREWKNLHRDRRVADPRSSTGFTIPGCYDTLWHLDADYSVGSLETRKFELSPGQTHIQIAVFRSKEEAHFIDECEPAAEFNYVLDQGVVSAQTQTLCLRFEFGEDCLRCGIHVKKSNGAESRVEYFAHKIKNSDF